MTPSHQPLDIGLIADDRIQQNKDQKTNDQQNRIAVHAEIRLAEPDDNRRQKVSDHREGQKAGTD